ncbi:MAG: hypothetical protein COC01_01150 [Bacteroidetes bacterium]|nr:gliding motility-associated C-terminal domain-containing protein [Bacteroidia bacterium]PCH69605.1 MAG: hypothetical protein COC01_01150 [Bacteroidota bacterium]
MRYLLLVLSIFLIFSSCKKEEPTKEKVDPNDLIVWTGYGKTDTASFDSAGINYALWIPNAFTPDGDGLNDIWGVKGFGIVEFKLTIIDIWDNTMILNYDPYTYWNGRKYNSGEIQPDGIYNYEITTTDSAGTQYEYTGELILMK